MGYEVIIDDSARKEFGRKYFGDTIKIINPKTGNAIIGNTGAKEFSFVKGAYLKASPKYGKDRFLQHTGTICGWPTALMPVSLTAAV